MSAKKGSAIHLWIQDEQRAQLDKLSERLELPKSEIAGRIMAAGIRALVDAGNRMPLPLRFGILNEVPEPESPPNRSIKPART
jgi:hypothetical protein